MPNKKKFQPKIGDVLKLSEFRLKDLQGLHDSQYRFSLQLLNNECFQLLHIQKRSRSVGNE